MRRRAFPHTALQRAPRTYLRRSGGRRQLAVVGLDGLVEDVVRRNLLLYVGQAGAVLPGVQLFLQEHSSQRSHHHCGGCWPVADPILLKLHQPSQDLQPGAAHPGSVIQATSISISTSCYNYYRCSITRVRNTAPYIYIHIHIQKYIY